jgi:flagellar biosynthetic protein FliR
VNLLRIDALPVIGALLFSIRVAMVLFMTPILGGQGLPAQIRVLSALGISLCLYLALQGQLPPLPAKLYDLSLAMLSELLWGALLAFGVSSAFSAFLVGGRLLDLQMGFGVATLFDPASRAQTPMIGLMLQMTGIAAFLAVDGHHMLLRALAMSFQSAPPGSNPLHVSPQVVLTQFGLMFSLGMVLVGAAVVCVFLVDVGMSVAARVLPQANVFLLSIPVKVFAGLGMLAISAPFMAPVLKRIYASILRYWNALLGS